MQPKIKVLQIVDSLNIGGAEKQVFECAKYIDKDKFDLNICSLTNEDNFLLEDFNNNGIPVYTIKQYGFFDYACLKSLVNYIRLLKPDIVHTFLFTADCYGRIAAKLAGVPEIISSTRNVDLWKKRRHILMDKILARFTMKFIANAEAVKRFLIGVEGINPKKIKVVYNGLDLSRFNIDINRAKLKQSLNIESDTKIVTMIARFSLQKDHSTFLKAASRIKDKIENVHFLLAGEGELESRIRDEIEDLGLREQVTLLSRRKDIPAILSITDVSVLATFYEGCSNVILESMAARKPIVATDVGGNRELIIEGKTGLLVKPRNPKILADKIIYFLENPKLIEEMGNMGRKRVEDNFSVGRMIDELSRIYNDSLK